MKDKEEICEIYILTDSFHFESLNKKILYVKDKEEICDIIYILTDSFHLKYLNKKILYVRGKEEICDIYTNGQLSLKISK